jgi:hypothetical protein
MGEMHKSFVTAARGGQLVSFTTQACRNRTEQVRIIVHQK